MICNKLRICNISSYCLKPLNCRVVCYTTIDNQNITACLEYYNRRCEMQEKVLELQGNRRVESFNKNSLINW